MCMDHACAGHGAGGEFDNVVIAMDERQRQIFEKAFAILDRREADAREHARWLGRHFDPVLGRVDLGEPTTEVEPTSPPPPQPRQTSQLTDAQILRVVDDRIAKAFRENTVISPTQRQVLGEALALTRMEMRKEMREHVAKEVAGLREENRRAAC